MRRALAAAALVVASPAGADALQDRVLAGMKTATSADVAFTQTLRTEQTGSAGKEIVARYDPRSAARWTVLRVDGHAPTDKERDGFLKIATKSPLPGYARLARWFGAPATRVAEAPGRVTYRFAHLPKDVVKMGSHDASADTTADVVVNTSGAQPYAERIRFASSTPFRMMLVAKVERYVLTASYAPLPDGRPFPTAVDSDIAGSMMGKSGSIATKLRYAEVRATR